MSRVLALDRAAIPELVKDRRVPVRRPVSRRVVQNPSSVRADPDPVQAQIHRRSRQAHSEVAATPGPQQDSEDKAVAALAGHIILDSSACGPLASSPAKSRSRPVSRG